ncbi:hypothetical protein [Endozoicomonas euniceicola]|uniref:Uncharacterized protein n=1 Tax=Endozoicomonas euniceicola TaxID=1234143 RepID=A0ABY6GR86_9GAMM|nr:hypothetical protein [Endozoicomonas euniceicola]UYM15267.1 hypothetical protein NX720_20790 [Endozoicomonas euniceicola]
MKTLLITVLLFFSYTSQADSETFDFAVEFGAGGKNVSIKAAPATGYLSGLPLPLQGKESFEDGYSSTYGGGDSPPDDKPRKPGGGGGHTTTLIESWSWQPLYASREIVGFLLSLTVDKSSLSGFTTSWKPVIGTLVVGWVIRTLYNPEQPLFNRMDAQQSEDHRLAIITYPKDPQKSETVAVGGAESGTSGARGNGGGGSGTSVTIFSHDNDGNSGDQPPQTFYHTRGPSCPHPRCNNGRCIEISVEGEEVFYSCVMAEPAEDEQSRLVDSQVYSTLFEEIDIARFLLIGMDLLDGNEAGQETFTEIMNNAIATPGISIGMVLDRLSQLVEIPESRITQFLPVESGSSYSGREVATRESITRGRGSNSAGLSSAARSTVNELKHAVRILIKGTASERLLNLVRAKANTIIRQLTDINREDSDGSFKNKVIEVAHIIEEAEESGVNLLRKLDTHLSIIELAKEFSANESWLVNEIKKVKKCVIASLEKSNMPAGKCQIGWQVDYNDGCNEKIALKVNVSSKNTACQYFYYFLSKLDAEKKFILEHMVDMESAQAASEWAWKNEGYIPYIGIHTNAENPESSYVNISLQDFNYRRVEASSDSDESISFLKFINRNDGKPKANYENIFKKLDELKAKFVSGFDCGSTTATRGGWVVTRRSFIESGKTKVPKRLIHYSDAFDDIFNDKENK